MPPKPTLDIDISEFRHMRSLMIKVQDRAKEIKHLQNNVLPKLQQQLADTKGIFKGKERKELESKIQQVEQYNRDLAKWEQQVREKEKPTRPPEKESVRDKLRQQQTTGKINGLRPPLTAAACFALWQTRRLSPKVLNRPYEFISVFNAIAGTLIYVCYRTNGKLSLCSIFVKILF